MLGLHISSEILCRIECGCPPTLGFICRSTTASKNTEDPSYCCAGATPLLSSAEKPHITFWMSCRSLYSDLLCCRKFDLYTYSKTIHLEIPRLTPVQAPRKNLRG